MEKTDLPVVTLKLIDDNEESCPFVKKDEGCIIYEDRPTACRYYPLGTGTLAHEKDVQDQDGFYFFVNEPHCKGFDEEYDWTVESFRNDQGVEKYDEINKGWYELVVMKRSFPPNVKFSDKAKELFFMVSYNLDKFKRFINESSFLKLNNIDAEIENKIKNDDIELLKFGFRWMKWLMFKEGDFKVNEEIAEQRKKDRE